MAPRQKYELLSRSERITCDEGDVYRGLRRGYGASLMQMGLIAMVSAFVGAILTVFIQWEIANYSFKEDAAQQRLDDLLSCKFLCTLEQRSVGKSREFSSLTNSSSAGGSQVCSGRKIHICVDTRVRQGMGGASGTYVKQKGSRIFLRSERLTNVAYSFSRVHLTLAAAATVWARAWPTS